jgi:LysM repeat protein
VDPGRRRELTRYGAPAAFLAAVTIAVLLIKAGLNNGSEAQPTTVGSGAQPTAATRTQPQTTTKLVLTAPSGATTTTTTPVAQYYVIQSGDTLGSIAEKYSTTVDELMTLNPGVDPTALRPGDRIRVG